jgi:hypothetical protein
VDTDEETVEQLKRIVRLLTVLVTKDMTQREQIQLLSSVGFAPKDVADLIETTPNTVSVTLSAIRKGDKAGKRRERSSKR